MRRRGVLLTTYGMVLHNAEVLGRHSAHDPDEGPLWDIMICGGWAGSASGARRLAGARQGLATGEAAGGGEASNAGPMWSAWPALLH